MDGLNQACEIKSDLYYTLSQFQQEQGHHFQLGVDHFSERNAFLPRLRSSHRARDRGNLKRNKTAGPWSQWDRAATTEAAAGLYWCDNGSAGQTLLFSVLSFKTG